MPQAQVLDITPIRPSWRQDFIARSAAMQDILAQIERLAVLDLPILIEGETGVGKEVVAKALHTAGRSSAPFIGVNCAAIPESLIEAELFGHAKGAFTGAEKDRAGIFAAAHGGTLLLDEVGEVPLQLQAKLLRVLEDGTVRRVGATSDTRITARIIAATNRDLTELVAQGRFREDLYYRLAGVTLSIPPLRQRPEDIAPLVEKFLTEAKGSREGIFVRPGTVDALVKRPWPGNVRELRMAVRRAVALGGAEISIRDFLPDRVAPVEVEALPGSLEGMRWRDIERMVFANTLAKTGTIRAAAEALGIAKSTLADRVRALRIPVPRRSRRVREERPWKEESSALTEMW